MIAVDSNIWIYYLDPTLSEHRHVAGYLEEALRSEEILTSTIIWLEVSHYLYRVSSIPKEKLEARLRRLVRLSSMHTMDFDMESYFDTIGVLDELRKSSIPLGGRDASIVAMMRKMKARTLVTHDKDFKKLEDKGMLHVRDPVPLSAK
ncbi:PIN domain-containing protein [Nitrososphaera sp.]|uniref:type II toxin-antitoxin system VapC family toxin n=1 Tax=Nitrososphaera sp. TaxID=1971748 RepID=UPI00317BE44E